MFGFTRRNNNQAQMQQGYSDYYDPMMGGMISEVPQPISQPSLTNAVFTIDEEVITKLVHFLKGQYFVETENKNGEQVIIWSREDRSKWLVTEQGLRFITNMVSSVMNNATTISHLSEKRINYEYLKFKEDLERELYRSFSIFFDKHLNEGQLQQRYSEIIETVPNYVKYLLLAVREGRVFNRLTTNVTESHVYSHNGEAKRWQI